MYMRNSSYDSYAKYNMDGLPPNYSGQFTKESLRGDGDFPDAAETVKAPEHIAPPEKPEEEKKEKRDGGGLLSGLFGGRKDGKKGGLLSGLFGGGGDGDNKSGGFLSRIEIEDLILIAVIFFLLKDGFEDDLIIILAILLFSS